MAKLEEAWQKILSSDEYQNGDDAFKERVKTRFFERTVGSSAEFKSAPPERQQSIQKRFQERLQPESTLSKVGDVAKKIGENLPGVTIAREVGKQGHEFAEGMRSKTDEEVIGKGPLQAAGRATATTFDTLTPDVEKDAAKPGIINKIKQAGKIAVGGTMQTGKALVEAAVPESTGGAMTTAALGPAEGIIKEGAPQIPVIGKILGADVGQYGESIIQKIRGIAKTPVENAKPGPLMVQLKNPLQAMIEEEMGYEKTLQNKAMLNGNPEYKPFLPEVKTNLSQLKDVHADRLKQIQAEPQHLNDLAYTEKLMRMPDSGRPEPGPITPEVKANVSQLRDVHKERIQRLAQGPSGVGELPKAEQEVGYGRAQESKVGLNREVPDTPQPPLVSDPDVLKFGSSRNLNDIKQKPLRNILKEMNDDIGHVGAVKIYFPTGRNLGTNDPFTLEAAKDLRVAAKIPGQKIMLGKFGDMGHGLAGISDAGADVKLGFYDKLSKKFYSREDAAKLLGWDDEMIKKTGGLGGEDLGRLHKAYEEGTNANPDTLALANDLRVAIREKPRLIAAIKGPDDTVYTGSFGSMHDDVKDLIPEKVKNRYAKTQEDLNRNFEYGFLDNTTGKFISRIEASELAGGDPGTTEHISGTKLMQYGKHVYIGDFGGTHGDSFKGKLPKEIAENGEFGFWRQSTGEFLSRDEAAKLIGKTNPNFDLAELHKAHTTYLGNKEPGLHSLTLEDLKKKTSLDVLKSINRELKEKGSVGSLGEADPARWDRLHQNTRELARRAWSLGYDTTEDIIAFAARNAASKEELHFLKAELGAVEPGPFDPAGLKDVLSAKNGNHDMRLMLWEKVKDRWTPNGKASQVRTLLQKHYGELAEGHLDSQYFIHNTTKHLSKAERQALTFVVEGATPRSSDFAPNAGEILQLAKKPTENMKVAAQQIKSYLSEAHKFLSDNFHDVGYVKDYLTHLWDRPNDVILNPKSNMLGTYNPFLEGRTWPSYAEGIDAGGTAKSLDVRDIISAYDKYKIKTVANMRFVEELGKMPTPQGLPAVMSAGQAPIGWIKAPDVPALIGKRVHPDYLQAIKTITDEPFSNKALRAYDLMGESQRWASLTMSPFHYGSLFTISSLSTDVPFKIPLKLATMTGKYIIKEAMANDADISFASKLLKAYQSGHAAFADMPLARRATRAGLNIGPIGESQVGKLSEFLRSTESRLDKFYIGKGIKAIRTSMDIFNKPLWDYFHAGVKLMTFQEHLIDNMKQFPDAPIKELEMKTARFVNDLDGGEAWQTMFVSPQYQKALHRAFFFPDWMVSRLRTAMTAFKPAGLTSLEDAMKRTPESYQAQKFWMRAGLSYYTFANWRNYANTKRDNGEGRYMWDNEPGKKLDVYKGKDPQTGRNIYMNYAPAVTEVFKWFQDPIKSIGSRFNPNLQLMTEFFTGNTLSGYKLPENQRDFSSLMKRHYAPVVLKGSNDMGLFPASRGMSSYEIIKRFEGVIKNGDDPAIAINFGVENGYNVEQLYHMALKNVRGNARKEAAK